MISISFQYLVCFSANQSTSVHSVLLQYDSNFTKEIQNKERVWRNRSNILQSTGKVLLTLCHKFVPDLTFSFYAEFPKDDLSHASNN